MKRLSFLLTLIVLLAACKKDHKELIVNKWQYDTEEMSKLTSEYLKEHPSKDLILKSYNGKYLDRFRNVTFDFQKNGKFVWNDHGTTHNGTWALADRDSTIVTSSADTMEIKYHILELTSSKLVLDDNVINTDKKFRLSKPILKPVK